MPLSGQTISFMVKSIPDNRGLPTAVPKIMDQILPKTHRKTVGIVSVVYTLTRADRNYTLTQLCGCWNNPISFTCVREQAIYVIV